MIILWPLTDQLLGFVLFYCTVDRVHDKHWAKNWRCRSKHRANVCIWDIRQWTLLVIVKDQSSHLVYLNIMHKITNLWKFELDWSSELRDNYERKKQPCHTKLCAFRWLISRPQILNLRSQNQISGKLILSWKLHHFRGSRFSQCFIPSIAPYY